MNKVIAIATASLVSLQSIAANAHPGVHGEEGFVSGLAHQFTQADHLSTFTVAAFGLILSGVVILMQRKKSKAKK
jgi:hydrogenase/urease accessory protein HupE